MKKMQQMLFFMKIINSSNIFFQALIQYCIVYKYIDKLTTIVTIIDDTYNFDISIEK